MSAAVSNPPVRTESKSAKKKKAKSEASGKPLSVTSTTPVADTISTPHSTGETPNGVEGKDYESPYIQELYKSIRNINKKINATAKVDSILAEHPNKSLDELVAERKINNDQKAQALKKPSLQASLSQLQEQVAQYKKFDQDYQARLNSEKAALKSSHKAELARVKDEAKKSATQEAVAEFKRVERQNTLLLSKFLRLAAAKRQEGEAETEDARALEGLLLMVYGGDAGAVSAAEKLIEGAAEAVLSTESQPLNYTYAQVKQAAMEHEPYQPAGESSMGDALQAYPSPPAAEHGDPLATTDPTIAHAGLNELSTSALPTNGVEASDSSMVLPQANIDAGAANEVAASHWDPKMSASAEDGWVEVNAAPRDPIETDNGVSATPAAMSGTQSWADEQPPAGPPTAMTPEVNTNGNDGFHEVHHSRGGRGRGGGQGEQRRGSFRGRGGYRGGEGGAYRGRGGFRGDRGGEGGHRGRGRGSFRGGRGRDGEHQRRSDES